MNLLVEIDGLGGEEAKHKAAARKTHWASGVNPLATDGRPAFAEFANVYAVQDDFAEAPQRARRRAQARSPVILVDSSVWIDHVRSTDPTLFAMLDAGRVLGHPPVTGEVALCTLPRRAMTIALLQQLPQAPLATDDDVMYLVERQHLHGRGIGWIDAHLLASIRLTTDGRLWTRDKRLAGVAADLGIRWSEEKS